MMTSSLAIKLAALALVVIAGAAPAISTIKQSVDQQLQNGWTAPARVIRETPIPHCAAPDAWARSSRSLLLGKWTQPPTGEE